MRLRIVKEGPCKGWVVAYLAGTDSVLYDPNTGCGRRITTITELDGRIPDFEDVTYVPCGRGHSELAKPEEFSAADRASCEKACIINQKRRESAVKRWKAARTKTFDLQYELEQLVGQVENAIWAIRANLVPTRNDAVILLQRILRTVKR